jgi:enoyl-CoA hydratase/carnithine racemase
MLSDFLRIEQLDQCVVLRLQSADGINRLTRACVRALTETIGNLADDLLPLIITGNEKFFSAGADLHEITMLTSAEAYEFAKMGQELMTAIEVLRAPAIAAISGYCMGGGLDLALACHRRIASPGAIFGHRAASLGLITGWGVTQRLTRLIGKAKALQMFLAAEKISAAEALRIGLVDALADDPLDRPSLWSRKGMARLRRPQNNNFLLELPADSRMLYRK